MRKSVQFGQRWIAAAGLMLGLAGTPAIAQQARKPVVNPAPEYPELAKKMNMTGVVKALVTVAADGGVKDVQIQGGNPVLADSVEKTLRKWKYAPASAESKLQMEFKF
jgi:TonB family protein